MNSIRGQLKKPFYKRKGFLWPMGVILVLIIATLVAFKVSPWPGAMVVRAVFSLGDQQTLRALERHLPDKEISVISNQAYRPNDPDAMLDVYSAPSIKPGQKLPTIIWTHGGAWLSGGKDTKTPYFKLLASMGVTVVALNYSLAPEKTYPTAVLQLNDAHKYIKDNAERFRVDTNKVFLTGDSAGSQLSAQLAALITNPDYAKEMSITPAFKPKEVRGTILFCGIYKMEGLVHPTPELPKIVGWGDDVSVWAYTGSPDFSTPPVRQMSAFYHVTKDFPATFISGGNGDPLTDAQSKPFASELESKKVEVTTRFFEADHQPSLPHEYQFNLDNQDGQDALKATIEFVQKYAQNT